MVADLLPLLGLLVAELTDLDLVLFLSSLWSQGCLVTLSAPCWGSLGCFMGCLLLYPWWTTVGGGRAGHLLPFPAPAGLCLGGQLLEWLCMQTGDQGGSGACTASNSPSCEAGRLDGEVGALAPVPTILPPMGGGSKPRPPALLGPPSLGLAGELGRLGRRGDRSQGGRADGGAGWRIASFAPVSWPAGRANAGPKWHPLVEPSPANISETIHFFLWLGPASARGSGGVLSGWSRPRENSICPVCSMAGTKPVDLCIEVL